MLLRDIDLGVPFLPEIQLACKVYLHQQTQWLTNAAFK